MTKPVKFTFEKQKFTKKTPQKQFSLAVRYERGIGVPKDIKEAVKHFKLAADKGHDSSQFNLARYYAKGFGVEKNEILAAKYYKLAADQGHAKAQFNVAICFANGVIAPKKPEIGSDKLQNLKDLPKAPGKAVKYYKLASDQGHAKAQFALGRCYEEGSGVKRNTQEAVKYYELAATQKHDKAQFNLGRCYENAIGVEKDIKKASTYYKLAADQGHESAKEKING